MKYSAQHNACVYHTQEVQRVLDCIPQARQLAAGVVAVPCHIETMRVMRNMGYEALSPILREYDWPRDLTRIPEPFDHQRHMSAFLTLHPRAFNLSDIGTGKTLGTLWAADYLMCTGQMKRMVIDATLSTLYSVWLDAIAQNFLGRRKAVVLHGSRAKRLELLNTPADFYIINHDGLGIGTQRDKKKSRLELGELARSIMARDDIDGFIIDEGSGFRASAATRYKVLRRTSERKKYMWWLTATPTPMAPTDAWPQVRIVRPDYHEAFTTFRDRTMTKITDFKWHPKRDGAQIASQILQPSICYGRDECLDLPPMLTQTRDIELTKTQLQAIKQFKSQLKMALSTGGSISAINEAALRQKIIQIACGAVYGKEHEAFAIDSKPRIDVLRECIEQTKDKLLIFAPLTSVINLLYHELSKDYTVERITGDVSATKRGEIFRSFQTDADPRIILADPRTMAHGVTLTAAATVLWYGPTDMAEIYQQANGRIDRPGQTKNTLVVRFVATAIEREIYRRIDNRDTMQGLILNFIKGD